MKHLSVKTNAPCEIIQITPYNPLVSKCLIKVCWVGDTPNRNKSIITKEVATEMANSLPGSPIVGYFVDEDNDFEEHSRELDIKDGKLIFKDITRPYGFVDWSAKPFFQTYLDDNEIVREYLCVEGWLWTGQYPECQRVIDQGNNQSMELDEKNLKANWTKDINGKQEFFIINEAIISKLCILGEEQEPCFEGSTIVKFSLEDSFKEELSNMIQEFKKIVQEGGGRKMFTTYSVTVGDAIWTSLFEKVNDNYDIEHFYNDEENNSKFAVLKNREDNKFYRLNFSFDENENAVFEDEYSEFEFSLDEEPQFSEEDINNFKSQKEKVFKIEDKDDKSEDLKNDINTEDTSLEFAAEEGESVPEEKEPEQKYVLEEIPEYIELQIKYSELETKYNNLIAEKEQANADFESKYSAMETEKNEAYSELETKYKNLVEENEHITNNLNELNNFKKQVEKKEKEDLINNTFWMLDEDDKKPVIDNIDKYTLSEIEKELSVICVRNKVSFTDEHSKESNPLSYNLNAHSENFDETPAWVKAVLDTAKTLN